MPSNGRAARSDETPPNGVPHRPEAPGPLGQMRFPSMDLKQPDTHLLPQPSDGMADGRLRPIELFGGGRKSPQFYYGLKDLPEIERRVHNSRIHRIIRCTRWKNAIVLPFCL